VYRKSICLAAVAACCCLFGDLASAQPAPGAKPSRPSPDALSATGPEVWDANGDGVYTCDEWKSYLDRWFAAADRNHDGYLDKTEFATIRRPNTFFADADFGYFDENQDGKVARKEFVGKPSVFILQNDKNGDCRVTAAEMKAAGAPKGPDGPGGAGGPGGPGGAGGLGGMR
jgi:hypothetical protein